MDFTGMLWRIEDKRQPLAEAVRQAADYYQAKYGLAASACWVHPGMLPPDGAAVTVGVIRVRANRTVLKNHLWLGVEVAN